MALAADEAGISRRYGGIHFEDGDLDSRRLGRLVAVAVWDKAQEYIHGTATQASPGRALSVAGAERSPAAAVTAEATTESSIASVTPNPGRGGRQINFVVSGHGHVQLGIIDILGRTVAILVDGTYHPGPYQVTWNGNVRPGIYFARLQAPGAEVARRLAVVN